MTISLPALPRTARFRMRPVYAASKPLVPAAGGPRLPVNRMGDHWAIEIETRAFGVACGLALMSKVVRGKGQALAIRIPQIDHDAGPVGAPVIDGAGQSGSLPVLRGLTPHYALAPRFVTVVTGGRGYTYLSDPAVADGDGKITLSVWPMLRVPHADGDLVEIAEPWIEGLLDDGGAFDTGRPASITPETIVIEESE